MNTETLPSLPPIIPGEIVFDFLREGDRAHIVCVLYDHGPFGCEVQWFVANTFFKSQTFTARNDATRDPRALAMAWAIDQERIIAR